ncbi:putative Receptor protein kinase [Melia azedarach]|uniref:Receptor protein kinase n=2 Tax=Melia azedarach TaxID=155640 RepID=A0ACC1X4W8_MELAZ|nr:putative Receptor protein kinase [Melia azedarach]KAJ4706495.1 putative Receptor protein kinase [Melia azedarach]
MSSLWRRNSQEKKDNIIFLRNGAVLLEKLITSCDGKRNPIRSFSIKELKIATDNFGQYQFIVYEAYKLYKGFLQNRPVSIMYWYGNDHSQRENDSCYNNIVFPTQMSHKNVLQLIGCCLDTEIPTLVFESAEKGTLADRIHGCRGPHFEPLLVAHRFKIAMEIANAVAYLHLGFRRPIVFRDIKPSKILFDEENVAKLFDFSLSESIPEGETHIKNGQVMGTYGFLAPEYLITSDYNEKCDVYSFGMLLLELLTGKTIMSLHLIAQDDDCLLIEYVKKNVENDTLNEITDPIILEDSSSDGKEEQILAFLLLIFQCVNETPEERPPMMYVAKQLRQFYLSVA